MGRRHFACILTLRSLVWKWRYWNSPQCKGGATHTLLYVHMRPQNIGRVDLSPTLIQLLERFSLILAPKPNNTFFVNLSRSRFLLKSFAPFFTLGKKFRVEKKKGKSRVSFWYQIRSWTAYQKGGLYLNNLCSRQRTGILKLATKSAKFDKLHLFKK